MMKFIYYVEARAHTCDCRCDRLWDRFPLEEIKLFTILISSPQRLQNSTVSRERNLLTLGLPSLSHTGYSVKLKK